MNGFRFIDEIGQEFVTHEDRTTRSSRAQRRAGGSAGGFYEDVAQRERIEAMAGDHVIDYSQLEDGGDVPAVPPEYEHLRKGCRVQHGKFGHGSVIRIHTQPWPNTRVEVLFDDYGPKKLVLAQARLELT